MASHMRELQGEVTFRLYNQWLENKTMDNYLLFKESIPRKSSTGQNINKTLLICLHTAEENAKNYVSWAGVPGAPQVRPRIPGYMDLWDTVYNFFVKHAQEQSENDYNQLLLSIGEKDK